jgi:hypothetical protein
MMNLGADPLYGGGYTTSNVAQAYNNLSPAAKDVFDIAVSQGSDASTALIRAVSADAQFAAGGFTGGAGTSMNALAGGAVAGAAGTAATTTPAGYVDPLAGGAGFDYATADGNVVLNQMSAAAQEVYLGALAQGATENQALLRALSFEDLLLKEGLTSAAVDTSTNALLGGGGAIAGTAGAAGAATGATGATNALAGGDVVSTQVTPTERIVTVETNAQPERPLASATSLGIPAAGAGALGALGAGAAGAEIVGGGLTVPPGAGLGDAGAITTPGGRDATVAGGGGITAGTTGGAGLDTSGLALGGTLGAGAAAGSALSPAAGVAAMPGAAGLTGIKAVDDFLNYIGTPAGAAALGAFGSLAGGYLTGQAAKDAANIQAQSAQNALALQREQFEYQKGLLEPYRQAGESALGRLSGVMGLGGQPAQPQQLLDMDPGYAFRLGEGMKALERVQAARGNMLSGGAIKAGQRYAQDFASGEYGNAYNRLANIAGLGQTVGGQLGSAAQQFGQTAGETMSQGANALAAGRVGRTSGYMGGIGGAVGAYQNYQNQQQQNQLFGKFLDIYGRSVGAGI